MIIFDKRFEATSYCWKTKKVLWLSLIMIKEEHRNNGIMSETLEWIKTIEEIDIIIIPNPSIILEHIAEKCGFEHAMHYDKQLLDSYPVMIFKK